MNTNKNQKDMLSPIKKSNWEDHRKPYKAHYIRTSSKGQKTDIQERPKKGYQPFKDEGVSGTIPMSERPKGKILLNEIKEGKVSEVYVYSIDRLGRSTVEILNNIKEFTEMGVSVVSEKEGLKTLNEDGTENPMSKLLVGVLATIAEFEYNRAKERRNDGIRLASAKGKYKGRTKGTTMTNEKVLNKYKKVVRCLISGNSYRDTSKLCEVSLSTVQRVARIAQKEGKL